MQDLQDVAPDLKSLLEELQPLIDASRTGFPAAEKTLEDARPLIGQLGPATQQLIPPIQFLGLYKRELWGMSAEVREAIGRALEERFRLLLHRLKAGGTRAVVERHAPFVPGAFPAVAAALTDGRAPEDVSGLSD